MNHQVIEIDYSAVKSLPDLLIFLRNNGIPEKMFWRYIAAYQENKARNNGIPLNGQFELTPLCNLDCRMCYVHLNQAQLNGCSPLSTDSWKYIMAQAHTMGMLNATLTGGECLIYPGFDELYLYLRSLGIQTSIITNGVLLNDQRITFFNNHPPRSITVSLYGSSNEAYQKVTGHAVFDQVYDNLLKLKKVNYPVTIGVTPSKHMYDDIQHILKLVDQLGFPSHINISLFQPRKETGRELCDLNNDEYAVIFRNLRKDDSYGIITDDEFTLPERTKKTDAHFGVSCGAGRSSFWVNWHGMLSACENLNALQISLLNNAFSEAWKKIQSDALSYPLPIECSKCEFEKKCFHCVAYRCGGKKSGHCDPNICERTKLFVKEKIRM